MIPVQLESIVVITRMGKGLRVQVHGVHSRNYLSGLGVVVLVQLESIVLIIKLVGDRGFSYS